MKYYRLKRLISAVTAVAVICGSYSFAGAQEISDESEDIVVEDDSAFIEDESNLDISDVSDTDKVDVTVEEVVGGDIVDENEKIGTGVSLIPGENNAYVVMGENVTTNYMTYTDGVKEGIVNPSDMNYNEMFLMDGVTGRKVYKENYVNLKLSPEYYSEQDCKFMVLITYYDFGPSVGYFHVEYSKKDGSVGRVSIRKEGVKPKWCTSRILLDDASFGGKLDGGNDIRLLTNAYNAFAKVEIVNISVAERSGEVIELGTVNAAQAETLGLLKLMEGPGGKDATYGLEQKLTRGETVKMLLKAMAKDDVSLKENNHCSFSDVSSELAPYIGYGEKIGMISGTGSGLFKPDEYATPRQLMMFLFRILGIEGDNLYENAVEIAKNNKMVLEFDMILYPDAALTRDNFAAILYNSIMVENKEGKTIIVDNINAGRITEEMTDSTGVPEIMAYKFMLPRKVPKRTMVDESSGRTYYYLNIEGTKAIRSYVNTQEWNAAADKFIIGNDTTGAMYEYDVNTEILRFLDYCIASGSLQAHVVANDQIYYKKKDGSIWHMDWNTYEKRKIADLPPYAMTIDDGISVTEDGKYIGTKFKMDSDPKDYFNGIHRYRILARLNTETGEWDKIDSHEFDNVPQYPDVGHPIIHPYDENTLFFCHEGTTHYIPDRLWIKNFETGEDYNVFKQAERADGMTGEPSGHEMWSHDGESLVFVKYPFDTNVGKSGVVRVSRDGSEREYYNGDYKYWHCTSTANMEWVAADTQTSPREVVLISTRSYKSYPIVKFRMGPSPNHPYQPHPTFSWNGKMISWQMVDENDMLGTAWMDVSDITGQKFEGGEEKYNDSVNVVSYKNTEFESSAVEIDGMHCLKANADCGIYFDINDELIRTPRGNVRIKLTYLDSGSMPIDILYTSSTEKPTEYANQEDMKFTVERSDSGKWKTVTLNLKNAGLNNSGKHLSDFAVKGRFSEVVVGDVEVIAE